MRQYKKDFGSEKEQIIRSEKNPKLYYTFRVPKKDVYRPDQVKDLSIPPEGGFCLPNQPDQIIQLGLTNQSTSSEKNAEDFQDNVEDDIQAPERPIFQRDQKKNVQALKQSFKRNKDYEYSEDPMPKDFIRIMTK